MHGIISPFNMWRGLADADWYGNPRVAPRLCSYLAHVSYWVFWAVFWCLIVISPLWLCSSIFLRNLIFCFCFCHYLLLKLSWKFQSWSVICSTIILIICETIWLLQLCGSVPCHIFKFWAFIGIMFQVQNYQNGVYLS